GSRAYLRRPDRPRRLRACRRRGGRARAHRRDRIPLAGHHGGGAAVRPRAGVPGGARLSRGRLSSALHGEGGRSMEANVVNQHGHALPNADNAGPPRGLPAWTYFNAELTALEYERLIRPSWQFVCHVNQLKEPGAFATLDMMRDSVIVMRGK